MSRGGHRREAAPHALAGEHEVEAELDEQAKQLGVGGRVDLGEGIVEEQEPRRSGRPTSDGVEVGGGGGEQSEVGDHSLLALGEAEPVRQRSCRPGWAASVTLTGSGTSRGS